MSHEANESDESVRSNEDAHQPDSSSLAPIGRPKVLTFHKLLPRFSFGSTNYSPSRFIRLLTALEMRGFSFCSAEERTSSSNSKELLITFDDGYRHLANLLPELMERFGIKPLVFIPTAFIGRSNSWDYSNMFQNVPHLDRTELQDLAAAGVQFGSHGHTHSPLDLQSEGEVADELVLSRKLLQEITGQEIRFLSYPFGRFNHAVVQAARKAGYHGAFTMAFPGISDGDFTRGRCCVYGFDSLGAVRRKLEEGNGVRFERFKANIANRLSAGTIALNRIRGFRSTGAR